MNIFSQSEIERISEAGEEIRTQLAAIEANDHLAEKQQLTDQLLEFIRPGTGNTLTNLAHQAVDQRIESESANFISSAGRFYRNGDAAKKAAESTDLILDLHHRRNLLSESASIEVARLLLEVFEGALASNAPANESK